MRVAALYAYPVKSCAAVSLDSAAFDALGVRLDRRFAFVAPGGRALTQRDHPLLATIRPSLGRDALHLDLGGLAQLTVALNEFHEPLHADVWGNRVAARAAPPSAAVAQYLGVAARLLQLERGATRGFADAQPVLLATSAMLAQLNRALATPVGMERFRPNIVVEADAEDWQRLRGEEVVLERAGSCGRCEMVGDEPLRTLEERFGGNFGVYCRVARPGRLQVGEALAPA